MRTALLPAASIACELCMLAQTALGTRRSRPHAAPQPKRAAQTTCTHSTRTSQHSQSTGSCTAAEAAHLIDDHRSPRKAATDEILDCLCERGTASEGKLRTVGGERRTSRQSARAAQRVRFEVRTTQRGFSIAVVLTAHLARVRGGNPRACSPLRRKRAHAGRQR